MTVSPAGRQLDQAQAALAHATDELTRAQRQVAVTEGELRDVLRESEQQRISQTEKMNKLKSMFEVL